MLESTIRKLDGIDVHCYEGGTGFPILVMHGSGPGASVIGNFAAVLPRLAERYRIVATDMIGFGRSGRKTAKPYFDVDLWQRQAQYLLDELEGDQVGILAHSFSSRFAFRLAATSKRVAKVLATGSVGVPLRVNEVLDRAWAFPRDREALRALFRNMVYDSGNLTEAFLDDRMAVLNSEGYEAYFSAMFEGDKQAYLDSLVLDPGDWARIRCPVLLVHGKDDKPCPYKDTAVRINDLLPQADLVVLARCGHGPAQEHPARFLSLARDFFG